MRAFRLAVFFSLIGLAVVGFAGCRLIGLVDSEAEKWVSSSVDGSANVAVKVVIPSNDRLGARVGGIASSILTSTGANPRVTFRLVLIRPGDPTPTLILTKTVETSDGTVQVNFSGIPAVTCLGEMVIENGTLGGKTDFHGALDLTIGDNILQIVPKGCGDRNDIIAAAIREIWNSPILLEKNLQKLVSLIETSGAKYFSASPTADLYEKVFDSFVTANLAVGEYTRLDLNSLNSTLSASGKYTWTKTIAEVASTPAGASEKTYSFAGVLKQGYGTFAYVAWQSIDGNRFGISKLDLSNGNTDASIVVEGPCGPTALLPSGGILIGGTVGGYPILIDWDGTGTQWVHSGNYAAFSAGWAHSFALGTGNATVSMVEFIDYTQVGSGLLYCVIRDTSLGLPRTFRVDPANGIPSEISTPQRIGIWAVSGIACVTIGWETLPGTFTYTLYWSNVSDLTKTTYAAKVDNAVSPFKHDNLVPGQTYYYLVVPYADNGDEASPSNVIGAVPSATPSMRLYSSAFDDGGTIPAFYAAKTGKSPSLCWAKVPEGAKSLAVTCSDLDTSGATFTHWLIYDIPTTTTELKAGIATLETLSDGVVQGYNDFGDIGYGGPNPPVGSTHRYQFTLFALETAMGGTTGLASQAFANRISGHVLASASITGLYSKPAVVTLTYSGTSVSVDNPMADNGIAITTSGADVTVNSTISDNKIKYILKGTTTDGSFKIYSSNDFDLLLSGIAMTNTDGPAINIQSVKKCEVTLDVGTTNTLADGTSYATNTEDQKGTIFSEGQLEFKGTGTLTINGYGKNAICSDNCIEMSEGNITISSAVKDGIHSKDHFSFSGGTLNVTAASDGIDCENGYIRISGGSITTTSNSDDAGGLKCDGALTVTGGTINVTVGGNQSKGIKSSGNMTLTGGTIKIDTSGSTVLTSSNLGYDPSYCTAVKSGNTLTINGATITITSTGMGGKGISSDQDIIMNDGTVNITTSGPGATYINASGVADAYAASCMNSNGNMSILGGAVTTSSSGNGGKGLSADGTLVFGDAGNSPTVNVTTTGARILISGTDGYSTAVYCEPKAIKSDGAMTINNGDFTISTSQAGGQGLDSDATLTMVGGTLGVTIRGNGTKAIKSTQSMILSGGTISVTAEGNVALENVGVSTYNPSYCTGIKGNTVVTVGGAAITISHSGAGGKGISADGSFSMTGGSATITCSGRGATYANSTGKTDSYNATCITSDGGISILGGTVKATATNSAGKGLSSNGTIVFGDTNNSPTINVITTGAKFLVSGSDYCHPKTIVGDGAITINNGAITLSSTDDAVHSETSITQNAGTINITNSEEGIEAPYITVNSGVTSIVSSDDCFNATKGNGGEANDGSCLYLNGGTVSVNTSAGDGLDSNGNIVMTGGTVIVQGPPKSPEVAFDYNGTFNISGGLLISSGPNSGNMIQATSNTSTQYCLKVTSNLAASALFHIQDAGNNSLVTFKPLRSIYYIVFSSPDLKSGSSYSVYTGGSSTGINTNGLYTGGTYTGGTLKKTFTISSKVTTITY